MAAPQMVDIRQLNPQQLTEVSKKIETELQVLQGCAGELYSGKSSIFLYALIWKGFVFWKGILTQCHDIARNWLIRSI